MRLITSAVLAAVLSSSTVHAAEPEPALPGTAPLLPAEPPAEVPPEPKPDPVVAEPTVDKPAKPKPWKGFTLASDDGNFKLKVGTHLQVDGHFFVGDEDDAYTDTFRVRRFRPGLRATVFKHFDVRWLAEFAGSTLNVLDAVVETTHWDFLRLRVGKDKAPHSYDHLQSSTATTFLELGTTAQLSGNRDIGVQLLGDVGEGLLNYQLGIFDGATDFGSLETNNDDDSFELAGRVTFKPFRPTGIKALEQLAIGATFSYGETEPNKKGASSPLPAYRTTGGAAPFAYLNTPTATPPIVVVADGTRVRLGGHIDWRFGPLSVFGEVLSSSQELSLEDTVNDVTTITNVSHLAYQAYAAVLLTGDKADRNGVDPLRPFDPSAGNWGAFELAARFGAIDFDDEAFDAGLASAASSATGTTSLTFGLNWYFNSVVKLQLNYERTEFDGGGGVGEDKPTENFLGGRIQFNI